MILLKKSTLIVGMRGSGKSTCAHFIAEQPQYKALVYDTIWEFPYNHNKYDVYRPKDRYSKAELIHVINTEIKNKNKYNLLLIDEANRFIPGGGKALDPAFVDLNDIQRHKPYEIGVIWIARRPVQLHPDVVGLASNIICYLLTGANDIRCLNNIKAGLGDEVSLLKKYHAIAFCEGQVEYFPPVIVDDIWKRKQS
jgi:hypothetical protein